MINRKAAKRYARAVFEYACDTDSVEQVRGDLRSVCGLLETTPGFGAFIGHPLISAADKRHVLDETLRDALSEPTLGFLYLLIEHDRTTVLPAVLETYDELADELRGVVRAQVSSAVPLTESERAGLEARLIAIFKRRAELELSVAPELLGGVRVRVGDAVIDGTLRTSLNVMRDMLRRVRLRAAG